MASKHVFHFVEVPEPKIYMYASKPKWQFNVYPLKHTKMYDFERCVYCNELGNLA